MLRQLCILFYIILIPLSILSQAKNEKEERIDLEKLPVKSKIIIKNLPNNCKKLKFYKETDNSRQSYEAKFKFKKRRYSLEFKSSGDIEDLEVKVKFNSIDKNAKKTITDYLKNTFKSYKILKVQKQYILGKDASPSIQIEEILEEKSHIMPNYEIIAEVKSQSGRSIREILFSHTGQLLNIRFVNPSSYGHILY